MSDFPLHRHYLHYSELPYSQRVLYTAALLILGLGYFFALLNVYFTYAGRAGGNPLLLSYEDIVVAYSGSGKGSRLEAALRGPMSSNAAARGAHSPGHLGAGRQRSRHVRVGDQADARQALYDVPRRQQSPSGQSGRIRQPEKGDRADTGAKLSTLVRVSHIHLFGVTFIFFIVGLMFSHAYVRPVWLQMCHRRCAICRDRVRCQLVVFHQSCITRSPGS